MAWIYLLLAGAFEIGFATALKLSDGFTKLIPTIVFFILGAIGLFLLTKALQTIQLGTAYAVWTGIGAIGTVLIGVFFFNESVNFWRMLFLSTLIVSIIGLKLV
jgi:quaternary ammonium compound-resistance protein SugE